MMSLALQLFVRDYPQVISIIQRFCEPDHSAIQDVENLYSLIEWELRDLESMSPIRLVQHICTITPSGVGIYMYEHFLRVKDFINFASMSSEGNYSDVRNSEAKELFHHTSDVNKIRGKSSEPQPR